MKFRNNVSLQAAISCLPLPYYSNDKGYCSIYNELTFRVPYGTRGRMGLYLLGTFKIRFQSCLLVATSKHGHQLITLARA